MDSNKFSINYKFHGVAEICGQSDESGCGIAHVQGRGAHFGHLLQVYFVLFSFTIIVIVYFIIEIISNCSKKN